MEVELAGASGSSAAAAAAAFAPFVSADSILSEFYKAVESPLLPMTSVHKRSFLALFGRYLEQLREGNDGFRVDRRLVERAITDVYDYLPPPPDGILRVKSLLGKLVVLKIVRSRDSLANLREARQLSFLSKQIMALNREYGCTIPLVLAGNIKNELYITKLSMELSNENLTVVPTVQNMYPTLRIYDRSILPISGDDEDWYAPGDGDVLCSLFKNNRFVALAKEKRFLFFLGGETFEPVIDIKILNYLETRKFDFCIEATHGYNGFSSCQDLDRVIVSVNGKLKLLDKENAKSEVSVEERDKYLCWNTNNLWVGLDVLQDLSDKETLNLEVSGMQRMGYDDRIGYKIETRAASAVEFFKNSVALVIPRRRGIHKDSDYPRLKKLHNLIYPTFTDQLKLKILGSVILFYFLYHATLVFVSALLEEMCHSGDTRTWIEGIIWLVILLVYLFMLYKRRIRRVKFPLDPEDRKAEIRADSLQVALHGLTRLALCWLAEGSNNA